MMQSSGNVSAARNGGAHGMGLGGQHHNQSQLHNHCENSVSCHNGAQYQQQPSSHQSQHQTSHSQHFGSQYHSHSHHHGNRNGHSRNKGNNHHFQSHGSSHYYGGGGASSGGRSSSSYFHSQYNYHSHSPPYAGGYQVVGYHSQQYHPHNHQSQFHENPSTHLNSSSSEYTIEIHPEKSCGDENSEEQIADVDSLYQLAADHCSSTLGEEEGSDEFSEVASRTTETPPNFCQKGAKYGPES